jgi:hypothetical protein
MLLYSAEKVLGWRSQYEAMLRWYKRCEACHKCYTSLSDALDFILAFFLFCYHMRDYAIETGCISREEMEALIQSNCCMKICRDVCNRLKHHTITRNPSIDKDWSIGRELVLWSDHGEKLFLIADEKFDAMEIVRGCVKFWNEMVDSGKLQEPPNPFAREVR